MASTKLWGEIDKPQSQPATPDITADINCSMTNLCLGEFETDQDNDEKSAETINLEPMDPIMLYSIKLHKFAAEMIEAIQVAELTIESNVKILQPQDGVPHIPQIPPPPELYLKHSTNTLNYMEKTVTPFTAGTEVEHPELSRAVAKKVLMQCVATMFAHIGYETTQNGILLLMTDVLEDFLKKICLRLKTAYEEEAAACGGAFPHCAEKILIEMGFGGCKGIHNYYQSRVLKYVNTLYKRCEVLVDYYQKLLVPKDGFLDDDPDKHIFGINLDDEEDGVEFQIHANFEGAGEFDAQDIGLQLLQNLETETGFTEVVEDDLTRIVSSNNKKKRKKY